MIQWIKRKPEFSALSLSVNMVTGLALSFASVSCVAAVDQMSGYAMEMGVSRVQDYLFRYTRFNAESPYPCLRLELIDPQENWKVLEVKDICEMNNMRLDSDFSYAGFDAFQFKENSLLFKFTFLDKTSMGEYTQDCSIDVFENRMSSLDCDVPKPAN